MPFNVQELGRIAAESIGARSCVSISKLAEGGFNKIFKLTMDNGSAVIARIPYPNAELSFKTMASEAATMDFVSLIVLNCSDITFSCLLSKQVRTILDIPVPRVLAWSGKGDNSVGSEYIIIQRAPGTQLGEVWKDMEIDKKLQILDEIVAIEKKLLSLSFSRYVALFWSMQHRSLTETNYGNLYFVSDTFQGCENVEVSGNISAAQKSDAEQRFVIGPVADSSSCDGERANLPIDRGPCEFSYQNIRILLELIYHIGEDPFSYLKCIATREIAWLQEYSPPKPSQGIALLPGNKNMVKPTLWHQDMHASNIFVNDDKITSLIDWQDVWAGPLFLQARCPRLVDYKGEIMLKLPETYRALDDGDEKTRIRTQVEKSIIIWSYKTNSDGLLRDEGYKRYLARKYGMARASTYIYTTS